MTKKISKEAMAETIQRDNAEYEAMSPMQRRVRVAQEVLLMMRNGSFVPGVGYGKVCKMNGDSPSLPLIEMRGYNYTCNFPFGDLQPIVRAGGFECVGCAKAAVIVARAAVGNKVKITKRSFSDSGESDKLAHKVSQEVFGNAADLIEGLYEGWALDEGRFEFERSLRRTFGKDPKKAAAYEKMRARLDGVSRDKRMKAIYRNIVKNEGYLNIGGFKY